MKIPVRLFGWFILSLILLLIAAALAPLENSLGANIRLVYLHGAWVWAGLVSFAVAGLAGLVGLLFRSLRWNRWSRAFGLTALIFWLTYLPMSLLVMQINWGGLYFDEPRWRIPFTFAVTGVLLQAGLWLLQKPIVTSLANMLFGITLFLSLSGADNVLHPNSPVFNSPSTGIQIYFIGLVALAFLTAGLLAYVINRTDRITA
ncbi:MAG: hypothetical protein WCG34_11560 [Leptolinea sp.]